MSLLGIQSLVWHVATWYTIIGMTCRYLIYNHWYDMSLLDIQSLVWHVATWYTIIGMTCRYLIHNHWYDMSLLDIQSFVWHVATWYTIIGMTCRYLIHMYDITLLDIQSLVWHVATWYTTVFSLAWQLAGFVWNTPNAGLTLCHHISPLFSNFIYLSDLSDVECMKCLFINLEIT